jgi:CheY-like chemotaxis protein
MDMQMPVMTGYEAAAELRRRGYAGPILALTAQSMDGDSDRSLSAGCDEYQSKPIHRESLVRTIHKLADRLVSTANDSQNPEFSKF